MRSPRVQYSGAQAVVRWLERRKVDTVFAVPGLQIDPLIRALAESRRVRPVFGTHELAVGYMADGYARATGRLGICLSIGGCGAQALLPAIAAARADGIPMLCITGNVAEQHSGCGAFQDAGPDGTDDAAHFRQACRESLCPASVHEIPRALDKLAAAALDPPFAPVHLGLTLDRQRLPADVSSSKSSLSLGASPAAPESTRSLPGSDLAERVALRHLAAARFPVVLAGGGAVLPDASRELLRFAETFGLPVATTLAAKGLIPETHPLSLGNFGYGGTRRAHAALLEDDHVDLLLLVGADLNERDSLAWDTRLVRAGRTLVRLDPRPRRHRRGWNAHVEIGGSCAPLLQRWTGLASSELRGLRESRAERRPWIRDRVALPLAVPPSPAATKGSLSLDRVVTILRETLPGPIPLVVDAGLHRVFAGHYWVAPGPGSFFSACGLAPMGWALGAAVGISLAGRRQPVCVLTGDGCLQAHGLELATMVRERLPILLIACANGGYGSLHRRLGASPAAAAMRFPPTDWPGLARALGARAVHVSTGSALRGALARALASFDRTGPSLPCLLVVRTPLDQPIPCPDAVVSASCRPDSAP